MSLALQASQILLLAAVIALLALGITSAHTGQAPPLWLDGAERLNQRNEQFALNLSLGPYSLPQLPKDLPLLIDWALHTTAYYIASFCVTLAMLMCLTFLLIWAVTTFDFLYQGTRALFSSSQQHLMDQPLAPRRRPQKGVLTHKDFA